MNTYNTDLGTDGSWWKVGSILIVNNKIVINILFLANNS